MPEPLAGDKAFAFLWKAEFRAAMERVGARHGLPVVDPTPALQAAGGGALFMDQVHLAPAGHEVVAAVLEPHVVALLRKRP